MLINRIERNMKKSLAGLALAASVLLAPTALADPYAPVTGDIHIPNIGQGWCPGGHAGFGVRQVCAGATFPDGTFYIQKMTPSPAGSLWTGLLPVCVSGDLLVAIVAPSGCNG